MIGSHSPPGMTAGSAVCLACGTFEGEDRTEGELCMTEHKLLIEFWRAFASPSNRFKSGCSCGLSHPAGREKGRLQPCVLSSLF